MDIEYYVVAPVPACCNNCIELDCYGCDFAEERWKISARRELELKKQMKTRAISRYQREINEIDRQIAILTEGSK